MRYELIDDPPFLDPETCNTIIEMAKTRLTKSFTWDVATGSSIINDYRKSEQMFFAVRENPLIASIEERIAKLTGIPVENGEGLQIVHYNEGNYYYGHWDHFDPRYEGNKAVIDRGGQRIATVCMYLNNIYETILPTSIDIDPNDEKYPAGDTWFPKMNLSVKPDKAGKAIFWWNMKQDGVTVDDTTYHAGRPVPAGCQKWIATKWLRSGTFR